MRRPRQTAAHDALDPLRQTEAEAAAALHRLTVARENLDEEAARAKTELDRLSADIERLSADETRERELFKDADEAIVTLAREEEGLKAREASEAERLETAAHDMNESAAQLEAAEKALEEKSAEAAEIDARRRSVANAISETERRLEKITQQISQLRAERENITLNDDQRRALEEAEAKFTTAEEASRAAEQAFHRAEEERMTAQEEEQAERGPHQKAEQSLSEINAECEALKRVLETGANSADGETWPTLIESIEVEPGYENALAAALGDDLSAALDPAAPVYWSTMLSSDANVTLPQGAAPLSRFVKAPAQLMRRLTAIGVVEPMLGARLHGTLPSGVRLVSRDGDLWRWDGFVARAEAKTAAAIRLEQRNRLSALAGDLETARNRAAEAKALHTAAHEKVVKRQIIEREARSLFTDARRAFDNARTALTNLEREHERTSARIASIDENLQRLNDDKAEVTENLETVACGSSSFT